jgi:hypothetical protein
MSGACDAITPLHGTLLFGDPMPVDGRVTLTEESGFGLTLNPDAGLARPVTRDTLASLS